MTAGPTAPSSGHAAAAGGHAAFGPGLRGRLAPTPTGVLHVGHARTFAVAAARAGRAGLVLRIEDLDAPRCREEFVTAALDDLRWLGLRWTEGPDIGGPCAPYRQSARTAWFLDVWRRLEETGVIYPSPHSRRDVEEAASAPHEPTAAEGGEPIFPPALRPARRERATAPGGVAWRFRVPDGRTIEFDDGLQGRVRRTAGVDFGDFVVWRRDAGVAIARAPVRYAPVSEADDSSAMSFAGVPWKMTWPPCSPAPGPRSMT